MSDPKTRNYKGYCIVDSRRTIYTNPIFRINPLAGERNVRGYRIDGLDGRFFSTVKKAKSYIDNHLFTLPK